MTTETIFNGETPPTPSSEPTLQIPTEVAELVGEGKKYKSVEDALRSVPHAQTHIQRLEDEAKQLRDELAARRTTEELLEDIKAGIVPATHATPATSSAPSSQDIEQTVARVLAQKEAAQTAKANITKVVSTFQDAFGGKEKAEEAYNRVAADAGMSVEVLNSLAASNPSVVLKLAGLSAKAEAPAGKPHSTVNTQTFSQGGQTDLSAKVPLVGAKTKDVLQAWRNAGETVKKRNA